MADTYSYQHSDEVLSELMRLESLSIHYVVIGDVHGDLVALDAALAESESWVRRHKLKRGQVRYVFMGDLIDIGPDSKGVVARVREYVEKRAAVCLLGNHDLFLTGTAEMSTVTFDDGRERYNAWLWQLNGGMATCFHLFGWPPEGVEPIRYYDDRGRDISGFDVNVYRDVIRASPEYEFLSKCPRSYETERIHFCHAPQSKKETTPDLQLWGRMSDFDNSKGDACFIVPGGKQMGVHGHFHRIDQGVLFPRFHNYVHGGQPKTVVLADCGGGRGGRIHPVVIKEWSVSRRPPEIVAVL